MTVSITASCWVGVVEKAGAERAIRSSLQQCRKVRVSAMRCRKLFCSEIARQAESGVGRDAARPDASAQSLSRSAGARVRRSRAYVAAVFSGATLCCQLLFRFPLSFLPFFSSIVRQSATMFCPHDWLDRFFLSQIWLIRFGYCPIA